MWNNVLIALEIMAMGMGGIFIATLLIIALVMILGRVTSSNKKAAS